MPVSVAKVEDDKILVPRIITSKSTNLLFSDFIRGYQKKILIVTSGSLIKFVVKKR